MSKFTIEITADDRYDIDDPQEYSVAVTHNGYQWMSSRFTEPELRQLVDKVSNFLDEIANDTQEQEQG